MVRFENESIKEQAISLWCEAFGDSEDYIRFFLESHGCCECLTLCKRDELVSALYLIDGELGGVKGCYLFAAATFERFRGLGYMAELLNEAKARVKCKGGSFIALVPAEGPLFDYYSRFGYKTAFYAKKQPADVEIARADNMFIWCSEHIEYIKKEHEKFGNDITEHDGVIYSVFDGKYIKTPTEKSDEYRYGMLLPLDERANELVGLASYIGLTLE